MVTGRREGTWGRGAAAEVRAGHTPHHSLPRNCAESPRFALAVSLDVAPLDASGFPASPRLTACPGGQGGHLPSLSRCPLDLFRTRHSVERRKPCGPGRGGRLRVRPGDSPPRQSPRRRSRPGRLCWQDPGSLSSYSEPRAQAARGPGGSELSGNRAVGCSPGPGLRHVPVLGWGQGCLSTSLLAELGRETLPALLLRWECVAGGCCWGAVSAWGDRRPAEPGSAIHTSCPGSHLPGAWLSERAWGWGRLTCARDVCVCSGGGPASACR